MKKVIGIFYFLKPPLGVIFCTIFAIYIGMSMLINDNSLVKVSIFDYYNYFLDALFHARLNILPVYHLDLSYFHGKWFMYWGPSPILFILPFYLLFGLHASDVLYNLISGLLCIVLFYYLILQIEKHFVFHLSALDKSLLVLGFGLCSPLLYTSVTGSIWLTSQNIGMFYLLFSLLCLFAFLNSLEKSKSIVLFILAVAFFHLAWLSRATLVVYMAILIYACYYVFFHKIKLIKKMILYFLMLSVIVILFCGLYNFARFGNPMENGWRYQINNNPYHAYVNTYGEFSFRYLLHNASYYLFNPLHVSLEKPYIIINFNAYRNKTFEGNSVFSIYAVFLLVFFIFQKKYLLNKKLIPFLILVFLAIFMSFLILFMFVTGSGVESRYLLDTAPLLFFPIILAIRDIPVFIKSFLLAYGIIITISIVTIIHLSVG